MALAFLFPGQGAQWVGMGQDLYAEFPTARALYDEANDLLGYDLAKLSFEGPADTLTLTRHAQPALYVHSLACHAALSSLAEQHPTAVAGHSVGEYPALVVAGALKFADGLRLVQARGDCMDRLGEGRLAAFSLTEDEASPLAQRFYCDIAVINAARQTVVGGRESDLAAFRTWLEASGKSPGLMLDTAGAFHTHLMVPAALAFREHLDQTPFLPLKLPAISNLSGTFHDPDPAAVRAALFYQIIRPVRWAAGADHLVAAGHHDVIELGGHEHGGGIPPRSGRLKSLMTRALKGTPGRYRAVVTAETARAVASA